MTTERNVSMLVDRLLEAEDLDDVKDFLPTYIRHRVFGKSISYCRQALRRTLRIGVDLAIRIGASSKSSIIRRKQKLTRCCSNRDERARQKDFQGTEWR